MTDLTDGAAIPEDSGLYLSIADLARAKHLSRQAVQERVDKLERAGKIETRRGKGGTRMVNVAAYDLAVGETTDFAAAQAAETRAKSPAGGAYTDAQARLTGYQADLKAIELAQRRGELLLQTDVVASMEICGAAIVTSLEAMPQHADEIVHAMRVAGATIPSTAAQALAVELRKLARSTRQVIAENLRVIGESAETSDDDTKAAP